MKKSFVQIFWVGLITLFWLVGAAPFVTADQLQQARVSQVIQDVRVLETHGAPRAAAVFRGPGRRLGKAFVIHLTLARFEDEREVARRELGRDRR